MPKDARDIRIQRGTNNTCIAVHYMTSTRSAIEHFTSKGFDKIGNMEAVEDNLNCNEARNRCTDMAERGDGVWYFDGNWDYSAGRCSIYKFTFASYDGWRTTDPSYVNFVGYVPKENS